MTQEVYSDKQYEDFISKIDELGKRDHIEILRIIKEDDNSLKITENNNGCFINLNELEQSTLENVNNFSHSTHYRSNPLEYVIET